MVGRIYRLQGNYAQAESPLREALAIRRAQFQPDDPAVIDSLDDVGMLEANRGKFDAANSLLREALASLHGFEPRRSGRVRSNRDTYERIVWPRDRAEIAIA